MFNFSKPLGVAVRRSRREMGLSQEKAAEAVGCSKRTILAIENYKKYEANPKMETVYALVKFFGIDPRELFDLNARTDSPAVNRLHLLADQCSEDEAKTLLEILLPSLNAIRNARKTDL